MGTIGIIVVTHDSAGYVGPCLDACLGSPSVSKVLVVDNASGDGTLGEVRKRPSVRLIANPVNRGFAAAVNQGVGALDEELLLLLNPDAVPEAGLAEMAAACAEEGVGACGGLLLDLAGRPQTGFAVRRFPTAWTLAFESLGLNRLWPGNPVNSAYRCADLDPGSDADVDQPAGAFLLFRREAWERVGGFDEEFWPIWYEDVDFCLRLRRAGYRIRYAASARARHAGGHSVRNISPSARELWWYGSLLRYVGKHFPPRARRGVAVAVALASVPRALACAALRRSFGSFSGYSKVVRLAWRTGFGRQDTQASAGAALQGMKPVCIGATSRTRQDHLHGL